MPYFSQGPVQYLAGRRHSINTCGKRSRREIEGEKKRGGREREKKKEEEEEEAKKEEKKRACRDQLENKRGPIPSY